MPLIASFGAEKMVKVVDVIVNNDDQTLASIADT